MVRRHLVKNVEWLLAAGRVETIVSPDRIKAVMVRSRAPVRVEDVSGGQAGRVVVIERPT